MEYLIVQILGRQYVLKKNQYYDFDFIKNLNNKKIIFFNKILLVKKEKLKNGLSEIQVGLPFLKKLKIPLKFIQNFSRKKIIVLKTKPKKKYTRVQGFKKKITRLLVI